MSKKKDLETILDSGTKVIGAVVCWSLSGYSAPREAFYDAMIKAWPDAEAALSRQPSARAALRAAVERLGQKSGVLFRPLKSGGFAMVNEIESEAKLQHIHCATVTATETGLRIAYEEQDESRRNVAQIASIFHRLQSEWTKCRNNVNSNELSDTLAAMMNGSWKRPMLGAFNLRDRTGGVYFVPGTTLAHLRDVKAAIESLSTGCRIGILTVSGTHENLAEAAEEARKSLTRQLAEIRAEAEAFIVEMKSSGKSSRDQNLTTRSNRFKGLAARAELFRDILGDVSREMVEQIERARVTLLEEIEAL